MAVRLAKTAIIAIAEQNVGRSTELNSICDDRLNLIVNQLFENFSWATTEKSASITLTANVATWTVPIDYLKSLFGKLIIPNSSPAVEITLPIISFQNYGIISTPNTPGQPQVLAINRSLDSTGAVVLSGTVWPLPDQGYSGKLYYTAIQDYDVADVSAPGFFDLQTIVELLTNYLRGMGYGTEQGIQYDPQMLEKVIGRMRRNMSDQGIYPMRARLDGRVFRHRQSRMWPSDRASG